MACKGQQKPHEVRTRGVFYAIMVPSFRILCFLTSLEIVDGFFFKTEEMSLKEQWTAKDCSIKLVRVYELEFTLAFQSLNFYKEGILEIAARICYTSGS